MLSVSVLVAMIATSGDERLHGRILSLHLTFGPCHDIGRFACLDTSRPQGEALQFLYAHCNVDTGLQLALLVRSCQAFSVHGAQETSGQAHQVERGICAIFQVRPQGFLQILGWDVPLHTDGCRSSRQPVQLRQLQRCPVPDLEASPSPIRHSFRYLPTIAPAIRLHGRARDSPYHSVRPLLHFLSMLLVLNKQA